MRRVSGCDSAVRVSRRTILVMTVRLTQTALTTEDVGSGSPVLSVAAEIRGDLREALSACFVGGAECDDERIKAGAGDFL